ncbi:MAG: hypothetical protein WBC91_15880 [Phototrophicaceae bacterium]
MAWTQPKTWSNEPLIAGDMNTHIRDNLLALKDPVTDSYVVTGTITTTSTTLVSISANLEFTITTTGGDVMVGIFGRIRGVTGTPYFDIEVDGVDYFKTASGANEMGSFETNTGVPGFMALIEGLPAGSHTFKFKFRITAGTLSIYAGTQAWVREVS